MTRRTAFVPGGGGLRLARKTSFFPVDGGGGLRRTRNVTLFLVGGGGLGIVPRRTSFFLVGQRRSALPGAPASASAARCEVS